MEALGTLAGVAVGLALMIAAGLKLVAGPVWTKQAADMHVPRALAQSLPYVELAIGLSLIAQVTEPWPAVAAAVLLAAFTAVIALRILDGSRPPCGCFGLRSTRPLGWYHVVRNLALLGAAVVAALWA